MLVTEKEYSLVIKAFQGAYSWPGGIDSEWKQFNADVEADLAYCGVAYVSMHVRSGSTTVDLEVIPAHRVVGKVMAGANPQSYRVLMSVGRDDMFISCENVIEVRRPKKPTIDYTSYETPVHNPSPKGRRIWLGDKV